LARREWPEPVDPPAAAAAAAEAAPTTGRRPSLNDPFESVISFNGNDGEVECVINGTRQFGSGNTAPNLPNTSNKKIEKLFEREQR